MKKALYKLRKGFQSRTCLAEIQVVAKEISDLAMIHGYNGVESIARKLHMAIRCLPTSVTTSPHFISKIELAMNGIQDVAFMEDCIEERTSVEKVRKDNGQSTATTSTITVVAPDYGKTAESQTNAGLLFDIKEEGALMNLSVAFKD
ncbi:MAG: hypothetical protein ACE5G1_15485 [bacterium]